MTQNSNQYTRKKFSSQWAFILAAVGSAAGLGNVWRFPYLAYENGGGSFFIAYIVCLALIGLPFLILECGMGQTTGRSAPGSMARATRHGTFRFVGWIAIFAGFVILSYYVVISSWTLNYAFHSLSMPWSGNSNDFFFKDFLRLSDDITMPGELIPAILMGTVAIYLLVFIAIRNGTTGIEKIAFYITPIPFVLLIILAINSLTLKGASMGLAFIFIPDWNKLLMIQTWFAAASQVFFTLSIGFAVMFSYGALLKQEVNIKRVALSIITGDTLVAIIGSIVIFGVLGFMAQEQNVPVQEVVKNGIGLAFVALPKALSLLPHFSHLMSLAFFVSLFCLAFTSIISLFEAIVAGLMEAHICHFKRSTWLAIVLVADFALGFLYFSQNGLYRLDIVDHFVSGYILMAGGIIEALVIGWYYNARYLRLQLNQHGGSHISPLFDWLIKVILPIILFILITKQIIGEFDANYGAYAVRYLVTYGLVALVLIVIAAILVSRIEKRRQVL